MSNHVIFSRNADNSILTPAQIQHRAPAVFSTTKAERLSDRYVPLHTADLLPILADYGYHPVQAAQKRSRTSSPEHTMHMLAFAKENSIEDGHRGEIILFNSHDGTGSVRLFAGAFRAICSNGLVAGEGFNSRTYHNRSAMSSFEEVLRNTIETLPRMQEQIETLRKVTLTPGEALSFAKKAVLTRWDKYNGTPKRGAYALDSTAFDVLRPQRMGDDGIDAWSVLNRCQESVLRGHAMIKSITDVENNPSGSLRKARPVNSIKEHQRINSALWDLTEEFA